MIIVDEMARALEELGFQRGQVGTPPHTAEGYLWRADRVLVGVTRQMLEEFAVAPEHRIGGSSWPVYIRIELRFLHAADIFRKHGVPVTHSRFEQYLECCGRMGVFPWELESLLEFVKPDYLDLAMRVNMQTVAADLTADIFAERLAPILEALRHAEMYIVFGAVLDALRYELERRATARA